MRGSETRLRNMDDVMWYLSWGQHRPELGRFCMEFMSLVHVPYNNRWPYFRGWEYWTILRHLNLCKTNLVLDAGSLRSYTPVWLAREAMRVVCIDNRTWETHSGTPGQYTLEEWAQELQKCGVGTIEVHEMDMCDVSLPSDCFDFVVSWSVLEHIEQDGKASQEMHRLLKPGGIFAGTVDFGRPEESRPVSRLYSNATFEERIVTPAGWKHVAQAPPVQSRKGMRSAMAFFLRKE